MRVDDRIWRDPDEYTSSRVGLDDPHAASGIWWAIPIILVLYGLAAWSGLLD